MRSGKKARNPGSRRSRSAAPRGRPEVAPYLVLCCVAFLLYWPVLFYGFIGFDDTLLLVQNQPFLSNPANILKVFTQHAFEIPGYSSSAAYYRPIWTLSFMSDAQIAAGDPGVYHVTNVGLHALASCTSLSLLKRLGYPTLPSFFMSLFLVVHPVLVSAVAWVPGRVESLVTIFSTASACMLVVYLGTGRTRSLAAHLLLFVLAILTKESAIFLSIPLLILATRIRGFSIKSPEVRSLAAGWAILSLGWILARHWIVQTPQSVSQMLDQLLGNMVILVHHMGKVLVPIHLSVTPTIADTPTYIGVLSIAFIGFLLWRSSERRTSYLLFGLAWFLVFSVPALVLSRRAELEQRLFLPMIGLLVVFLETGLLTDLLRRRVRLLTGIAVLTVLAGLTAARISAYESRGSFWENAVTSAPSSSIARASLGAFYFTENRFDEAREQYLVALRLEPREPKVNLNLGVMARREGQLAVAIAHFQQEIQVNPGYADAYYNLAQTYGGMGDLPAAIQMWERTLSVDPNHRHAREQLARTNASR